MECRTCSESLTAFMDRELDLEQEQSLQDHLEQCNQCSQEYASLLYAYNLTEQVTELELDPLAWPTFSARLPGLRKPSTAWMSRFFPVSALRWIPLTTGALGLVVVSLFLFEEGDREVERSFQAYLQQREQLELRHLNPADKGGQPLFPNPFALHDHTGDVNPFATE